ncbi:MAG: hypothetical protein HY905_11215 [Deltaproteobacteria bacterium]|nr:hypothetical protein [Deltaproteobacteria bacterium]
MSVRSAVTGAVALLLAVAGCSEHRAHAQSAPQAPARAGLAPVSAATVGVLAGRTAACRLPAPTRPDPVPATHVLSPAEEQWGVEVLGVTRTSGGYMLDFRYRVVDPAKAAPLLKKGVRTRLTDEATGAVTFVPSPPTVGPLRQTTDEPEAGRTYFEIFTNPGAEIAAGSLVTVELGDFKAEHVVTR